MKLQKPFIGDFPITQHFGQNLNGFYAAEGLKGHQGIDFAMPNGTPVLAAADGLVIYVSTDIQKGEGVTIMSDAIFDYNGLACKLSIVVWHLQDKSIKVKVGEKVKAGQIIGLSNNTGQTTGPHLHFSIVPLSADGARRILSDENNGYKGCIDPLPYLDIVDAETELQKRLNLLPESINAIKIFQGKHGLTPDGVLGPLTRKKLMQ